MSETKIMLPNSFYEQQEKLRALQTVKFDNKHLHVSEFEDNSITPEMYDRMQMNSYAREIITPKLKTETLVNIAKSYTTQCTKKSKISTTYEEALIHLILPVLIDRLDTNDKPFD